MAVIAQLRLILCDPKHCSTPGLPVPPHLLKFVQVHVHCISDDIQPSHPLTPSSPSALSLSQYQGLFQWVSSLHQMTKILELRLQYQSFQWVFRVNFPKDWLVSSPCCPRDFQEKVKVYWKLKLFRIFRRRWVLILLLLGKIKAQKLKWPELTGIIQTKVIFLTQLQIPLPCSFSERADRYNGLVSFITPLPLSLWVVCMVEARGAWIWCWTIRSWLRSLDFCVSTLCCFCARSTQTSVGAPGSWMPCERWRIGSWNGLAWRPSDCPSTTTEEPSPAERSSRQSSRDAVRRA